jgi:hypothetical protein
MEPIAVSFNMSSFVVNWDKVENDGSEPLMILIANQMSTDFILPKGTLLGRIIFSSLTNHTETKTADITPET